MKVPQKQLKQWLEALRSGEYEQDRFSLQNSQTGGYCCLGVACKVVAPDYKKKTGLDGNDVLVGEFPLRNDGAPKWLTLISDDVRGITGTSLTTYNDHEEFTFNEIADLLESLYLEG
jgi:hypothetical protein